MCSLRSLCSLGFVFMGSLCGYLSVIVAVTLLLSSPVQASGWNAGCGGEL